MKKGFSLIEIIIAFAIALIVFISVFEFVTVAQIRSIKSINQQRYDFPIYRYGEKVCYFTDPSINSMIIKKQITLNFISTSTPITSLHHLSNDLLLITTNSASTSEKDLIVINQSTYEVVAEVDIGPGIEDSVLIGNYLYVANTSINSHIKVFHLNSSSSNESMFEEIQNIKIDSLTQSGAIPKSLHIFDHQLMLGTEKNNMAGELFPIFIGNDNLLIRSTSSIEIGGQVHELSIFKSKILVSNSGDPELRLYSNDLSQIGEYDAPLTLGNGKSSLNLYPYIILGRTVGSSELSLLEYMPEQYSFKLIDTRRTNGTVDYLQFIISNSTLPFFLALTSNTDRELQVFSIENTILASKLNINLASRITAFECTDDYLLLSTNSSIPTIIWISK